MPRFYEQDGPYTAETELFLSFGYDAFYAGSVTEQYGRMMADGLSHVDALAELEKLHSLPPGQINDWLAANQAPEQPSS